MRPASSTTWLRRLGWSMPDCGWRPGFDDRSGTATLLPAPRARLVRRVWARPALAQDPRYVRPPGLCYPFAPDVDLPGVVGLTPGTDAVTVCAIYGAGAATVP